MEDTGQDGTTRDHTQGSVSTVEGNFHIRTSAQRTAMSVTSAGEVDILWTSAGKRADQEAGLSLDTDAISQVTVEVEAEDEAEGMAVATVEDRDVEDLTPGSGQ